MSTSITSDLDQRQRLREAAVNATTADTTATNAQSLAQAAQIAADAAQTQADTAASAASAAQSTANGKNKVTYSTSAASGMGTTVGDLWYQVDGLNRVIGMWVWEAVGAWGSRTIESTVIANLDAGKITAGTIDTSLVTIRSPGSTTYGILDGTGLRAYAAGTKTVDIDFTTGNAMLTGTYRNAPVGSNRLEIAAYSVALGRVGFVTAAGTNGYGLILGATSAQIRPGGVLSANGNLDLVGGYGQASYTGTLNLYGNIGGAGTINIGAGGNDTVTINGDPLTASAASSTLHPDRIPGARGSFAFGALASLATQNVAISWPSINGLVPSVSFVGNVVGVAFSISGLSATGCTVTVYNTRAASTATGTCWWSAAY